MLRGDVTFPEDVQKGVTVSANAELGHHLTVTLFSPHSQWFSVLSQVHASTDQEIREMHDEQANPQNAVVREPPGAGVCCQRPRNGEFLDSLSSFPPSLPPSLPSFLGPHPRHIEVPRLGVLAEL